MNELESATKRIRAFRDARDWKKFHNPKNLACSISIEAAELLEHFQWKTPKESAAVVVEKREALSEEVADVAITSSNVWFWLRLPRKKAQGSVTLELFTNRASNIRSVKRDWIHWPPRTRTEIARHSVEGQLRDDAD